jgi:hypothetical protein
MDNFRIDVTSNTDEALASALTIAFGHHSRAVGFRVVPEKGLVLYWAEKAGITPFAFKMAAQDVLPVIKGWLAEQDFGKQPDHDGDNGKAWRLYNEAWGHVGNDWEAFLAVQPAWAMYGK